MSGLSVDDPVKLDESSSDVEEFQEGHCSDTEWADHVRGPDEIVGRKRKRKAEIKGTRWTFTLNNPTVNDIELLTRGPILDRVQWIIFGFEKCPTTGTPHLQGALVTVNRVARNTVNRLFLGNRGRLSLMMGSIEQNVTYCSKEGHVVERGPRPLERGKAGGEKTADKWKKVKSDLKDGHSMKELAEDHMELMIKHGNGLEKVRNLYQAEVARKPVKVQWFWGETGAGKSFRAEEEAKTDGRALYRHNGEEWWDGYDGHPLVIIDDIDAKYNFKRLLKHTDVYNVLCPIKGGHTWLRAEKIWITSSFDPATIDQGGQLARRVEVISMEKANRPDIRSHFRNKGFTDRDVGEFRDLMAE